VTTIFLSAGPPGNRLRRVVVLMLAVGAFVGACLAAIVVGGSASATAAYGPVPQSLQSGSPGTGPLGTAERCSTPSNDMVRGVPWTQKRLDLPRVWELTSGQGVVVGVVDTGVDATVPQLAGHVMPGLDLVNARGTANTDCFGHGTFVAGIIGAQHRAGTGMAGVAPDAMILPIRQANNATDGTSAGLAKSIRAAVDGGAKVINISASSFFPSDELHAAVGYATARDVLLVASASNEAQQGNPKAYPAAYPEVIAVGAIGQDGRRTDFSEVGNYLDLMAPGVNVISLSRAGQGHLTDNGTSYATPFVAGTAALVRAYHPKLTATQVKRRMELTADHPGTALPDPGVGWGVVNPYNAVAAVLPDELGAGPRSGALKPMAPVAIVTPSSGARDTAVTFAVGGVATLLVAAVLAYVLPRGVRRGWRPAGEPVPATTKRGGA
jgi:type VII secretion-associated serine protease mycosin